MATAPAFAATPRQGTGSIATADTGFGNVAPTNFATVFTGGASGSRVDRIRFAFNTTTSAAGLVNVFIKDTTPNYRLVKSVAYTAVTVSTTTGSAFSDGSGLIEFTNGVMLPSASWALCISFTAGTGTLVGTADGGDF